MNVSAFNPEFVRNVRIHLRPGRMIVVAAICAAITISAAVYYFSRPLGVPPDAQDGRNLLIFILSLQIVALLIGGGIYCLQSIHREKDLGTFDYQRVTRLTPFELVLGKLFGAPIQMYFSFLCLMPIAIWAAVRGEIPPLNFCELYLIVILGSITYHALALVLSLVMERGTAAGGIILFLIIVGLSSVDFSMGSSPIGIHAFSPFSVYRLFPEPARSGPPELSIWEAYRGAGDTFFGFPVSHFWMLIALYVTLAAWFLIAAVRNIKRDPLAYELYSPAQGFAFVLYLNALMLGFLRRSVPQMKFSKESGWYITRGQIDPGTAEIAFLCCSLFFFALFGLTLLRNRDLIRRRLRELGGRAAGWWAAIWPAPYLLLGSALAGVAIVSLIYFQFEPGAGWSSPLALLEAAFFCAWIVRDALYIQWMNLRRVRRPVMVAVLYMVVFYACASALFVPLHWYVDSGAPFAAIFVPLHAFQLSPKEWPERRIVWILSLGLLVLQSMVFAWLQHCALQKMSARESGTEAVRRIREARGPAL